MVRKVIAYITRQYGDARELSVFEHADFPEAGIQVPKGTVEPGEAIEHAARREVHEETGLTHLDGLKRVGSLTQVFSEPEEWIFFSMHVDGHVPDSWIHHVVGNGEECGMKF